MCFTATPVPHVWLLTLSPRHRVPSDDYTSSNRIYYISINSSFRNIVQNIVSGDPFMDLDNNLPDSIH